jgi:hypothetical protein
METNSNKKINPIDYEGDMARLCEKIRMGNDDYEFSTKEMIEPRTVDLKGLGRQGYSKEGYSDIKIPIVCCEKGGCNTQKVAYSNRKASTIV